LPDASVSASLRAMITIQETLVVDAEGHAVITLPPSVKPGPHRAVVQIEDEIASVPERKRVVPKAGSLKGIWMSPDFDAPLEDFQEYME
jgi:hypothetical protein